MGTGYRFQVSGYKFQVAGYQAPVTGPRRGKAELNKKDLVNRSHQSDFNLPGPYQLINLPHYTNKVKLR